MADLVIRGARICDGSGAASTTGDLAVTGDRITTVGRVAERGDVEVDAGGLALAPGFIDLHTHYDCQLFWDPSATPSPWHGVTTVVTGNCGFTIAPCRPDDRETLMKLLLYVEGMPLETLRAGIRWAWEDFTGYLAALDAVGPAVNVVPFIGHSAMRLHVMGRAAVERTATAEECAAMAALVADGMRAGAIGWSTSRSPTHFFGDGTPAPSRLADEEELLALARALRPFDRGVIEVAPKSLIGAPDDKAEEQQFFARMAEASDKLVSWAPLLQNPFAPGSADRLIDESAQLQAKGIRVVPQVGCRPVEVRFDFAAPGFFLEQNPVWRPFMAKPADERRRAFADPAFRKEIANEDGGFVAYVAPAWDRIVLRLPASERMQRWRDASVTAIAAARGTSPLDAFCDVILEDDLAAQWGVVLMNHEETELARLIRHPAGLLALSDAGAHVDTLCDQGFTTSLLGHWVRERQALSLEEAVRLISAVPAERYGIRGRGRLAPGWAADLVLFDPARVATEPTEMVHDLPQGQRRLLQRATGIEWVFVNGKPVVARGRPTEDRSGRVLRGGGSA